MRIKHWQGYGTVNAVKQSMTHQNGMTTLVVKVTGNHKYGLVRDDEYDLGRWLVKRFDRNFDPSRRMRYTYESGFTRNEEKRIDEEYCTYTFTYESD